MRKVREILRLTYDAGLPSREVERQVGVGSTGVRVMLQRFRASKLEWPLPDGLTDTALEAELYGLAATRGGQRDRPEPDWAALNRELKRKHVTLQVLWDECIGGYRYSGSASCTAPGKDVCRLRCGRRISVVTGSSSTMQATPCRWWSTG
jgi:hypothetical protein